MLAHMQPSKGEAKELALLHNFCAWSTLFLWVPLRRLWSPWRDAFWGCGNVISDVPDRTNVLDHRSSGVNFKSCNDFHSSDCATWRSDSQTCGFHCHTWNFMFSWSVFRVSQHQCRNLSLDFRIFFKVPQYQFHNLLQEFHSVSSEFYTSSVKILP